MSLKVLVACECSQVVAKAFERYGCESYSCDIQPSYGGRSDIHIMCDCLDIVYGDCTFHTEDGVSHYVDQWDIIVAHPPCQYLTNAGNAYLNQPGRFDKRLQAASFFMKFTDLPCRHVAIENPCGYMNSHFRLPDQTVHPYFFLGADGKQERFLKRTCFWLKGLPALQYDTNLAALKPDPVYITYRSDGTIKKRYTVESISGRNQFERSKKRSHFYYGMADAMATQWVNYCNSVIYLF